MQELDYVIEQELYFEMQKIEDDASMQFNWLLLWIIGALKSGKSVKRIKQFIHKQNLDKNLEDNLRLFLEQQYRNITGEDEKFNLGLEAVAGYTFLENIRERKVAIKKRAVRFMARAKELLKTDANIQEAVREELGRYIKDTESFWRTNAKAGREYGYQKVDELSQDEVRGWVSVAILDSKTSAICAGLHNQFYSKKEFKSRADVPDKPPRHPNCRSILVTVWAGTDIRRFKGQNLNTFLKRNPKVAKDIMGIEKYRLWSGGKAKIDKYIDLKGRRWYRNDEIIKRLGIKAKKRLQK